MQTEKPIKPLTQYTIATSLVLVVTLSCFIFKDYISYHAAALILFLAVSIIAALFDIYPVLFAAALSALALNFFFIPPLYTLHINTPEDLLMLMIYFALAIVNAVFRIRIRREERKTRERASRRNALKLYNTLFNSLSHELKTPISTIIGSTDLLKEQELTPEQREQLLDQVQMAGVRLNQQVENLLNMSRLESGMLVLNKYWCDVNEMLHQVLLQVNPGKTHLINIVSSPPLPLFKLDAGLLQQALINIVRNATLYTPPGSVITIKASCKDDNCVITIADNGPGLPEDALIEVFDKFYRSPGTKAGGTGLGLSIAKGFVEAHGGTIKAENDDGAKFTIKIPAEVSYLNNLKNE